MKRGLINGIFRCNPRVWGGLKRYIEYISINTNIYDYVIGDRNILEDIYPKEKIIASEIFTEEIADFLTEQDILHFPANLMTDLKYNKLRCKTILTFHDCIPLRVKVSSEQETKKWKRDARTALDRADMVIAVSQTTKDDIGFFFPEIAQSKIYVIYNAVSSAFRKCNINKSIETPYKYSYFLGRTRIRHKNFWRSLLAFRFSKYYKSSLLFTTLSDTPKINSLFLILGMRKHVYLLGDLTDDEMNDVFNQIDAIIFMSLYEGFGLPPLEAMSCGAVAICSDTEISHEIYEDAPYYANPYKIADIMRAIALVSEDPDLREKKKEIGQMISARYKLDKMVLATADLIEQLKLC